MIKRDGRRKLLYSGGEVLNSTLDWLAALAHASDDAIIGSRLDRTITYWNESATRLYEGMDEETQERIFDPFFSTKFQGRGLELAAVSGITKASGGGIVLESSPGSGTRIALLFPMANADN